jgi:hypothetical protein
MSSTFSRTPTMFPPIFAVQPAGAPPTAVGFALGELLLLTRTPDELLEHLRNIHVTARATIICTDPAMISTPGVSLSAAALEAVLAWNKDDPAELGDAMDYLSKVLEEMGVLRILS